MKKLTILVDMDGITADLVGKILRLYNDEHGTAFTHDHVTDWNFDRCIPEGKKIFHYMDAPGFFRDLEIIPGTVHALRELHELGHDLHIASTPHVRGTCAQDKLAWVDEHLPFIGAKKTILVRNKEMLKADVLIDDKPSTLASYRQTWPSSFLTSIAYPYNEVARPHANFLAPSHADFENAWMKIADSIINYSKEV